MKFISVILLALSFSAWADQDAEMFKKGKEMILSNMDKRISILQESKSCISAASNREQLNGCRKKMKEKMKEVKDDSKSDRAEFKKMKEQKKADKKAKKKS